MVAAVEYPFGGERIAFNIEGSETRAVYLTIRGEGCVEITSETDTNFQDGEAITHTLSKAQVAALREWLVARTV